MDNNMKKFAPAGLYLTLIAAAVSVGLFIVQRKMSLPLQISLGCIVLGLALYVFLDPKNAKEMITGRQGRNTSNTLLMTIAILGIVVVINYLGNTNSTKWDLTENLQNSLTPETLAIIKALPAKVNVTGFFSPRYSKETATRLLENYKTASEGKFDYKFVDPDADPVAAQAAQITRDGTLVFSMAGRTEQITYPDEKELSSALVRLSNPEKRNIYFLTGHGEYELEGTTGIKYSIVKTALEAKNYTVHTLNLLNDPTIPDDALSIVIAGGKKPLNDSEVNLLKAYLQKGKAVVWLDNPVAESGINNVDDLFSAYLKSDWGITIDDDLMIDTNVNPPTILVADKYGNHPITNKLQGLVTLFPGSRSIQYDPQSEKVVGYPLVTSSATSWGEMDTASIASQKVSPDSAVDRIGPLEVAIAAKNMDTNGRLVVIGDAEFANDDNFNQYGNGTLLINSIDWAAGQEDLINMTPRQATQRILAPPTVFSQGLIMLVSVFIIPGLILVVGIITWIQRKKRG
jgi:ABC-type uncharacterized transport system involved in gliding motility auxiliary subunit